MLLFSQIKGRENKFVSLKHNHGKSFREIVLDYSGVEGPTTPVLT